MEMKLMDLAPIDRSALSIISLLLNTLPSNHKIQITEVGWIQTALP